MEDLFCEDFNEFEDFNDFEDEMMKFENIVNSP